MEIQLNNLGMKFGQIQIFSGLNATLKSGGLIGLLGPNGAGLYSISVTNWYNTQ